MVRALRRDEVTELTVLPLSPTETALARRVTELELVVWGVLGFLVILFLVARFR